MSPRADSGGRSEPRATSEGRGEGPVGWPGVWNRKASPAIMLRGGAGSPPQAIGTLECLLQQCCAETTLSPEDRDERSPTARPTPGPGPPRIRVVPYRPATPLDVGTLPGRVSPCRPAGWRPVVRTRILGRERESGLGVVDLDRRERGLPQPSVVPVERQPGLPRLPVRRGIPLPGVGLVGPGPLGTAPGLLLHGPGQVPLPPALAIRLRLVPSGLRLGPLPHSPTLRRPPPLRLRRVERSLVIRCAHLVPRGLGLPVVRRVRVRRQGLRPRVVRRVRVRRQGLRQPVVRSTAIRRRLRTVRRLRVRILAEPC